MAPIVEVHSVRKTFGSLVAVDGCTLSVERGSVTGLIGPNGAGKSTLFNIVAGTYAPDSGTVIFDGQDVTGFSPHRLFARGLLRTFQIPHEFSNMTVMENLMIVPGEQSGEQLFSAWLQWSRITREEAEIRKKALEVVDFLRLSHVRNELAGNLSGGQKKLLELGRTMMVDARIVLLDEIAAGVNRTLMNDLAANIERLNRELGYTFFVIEHDMDLIGRLCDPVIVMASGSVMTTGSIDAIKSDPEVIEAYFGGGAAIAAEAGA